MDARLVSRLFLALGFADLAVMNLVLAPRLAHHEAPPAQSAPVVAAPPPCPAAPSAAVSAAVPSPAAAERAAVKRPGVGEPAAPDVVFHFDGQRLSAGESTAALQQVAVTLRDAPERRLLLRGHADRLGTPMRNLALSRRRAEAVQSYLMALGVPGERIDIEAVGDAEPLDASDTPTGWARNRRVQILWR